MKNYVLKLKWIIIIKVLFASLSIVAIASVPYITKLLIDYDFSSVDHTIIYIPVLYLVAIIGYLFFERISQISAWKLDREFNLMVKKDIFNSISSMTYIEFAKKNIGDYLSVVQNDVAFIEEKYVEGKVAIFQTIIQVLIYSAYLFLLDYRVLILVFLCTLLGVFIPSITSKELSKRKGKLLSSQGLYFNKFTDLLQGAKNINPETRNHFQTHHYKSMKTVEDDKFHYGRYSTFTNIIGGVFAEFIQFSVFVLLILLLVRGQITVGVAAASIGYAAEFLFPLRYLIRSISDVKSTKTSRSNILEILEHSNKSLPKLEVFSYSILFKNVGVDFQNFSLTDFSFEFVKGKKYGIIGASGSGKTTIFNLLMKNIIPNRGNISIDNQNIEDFDVTTILALNDQFEHIFMDSLSNNISLFENYQIKGIENIPSTIYEKINVDNCSKLSGGEKQIISLLRLVSKDKEVILIDESFSALDSSTKRIMENYIYSLPKTIIEITHDESLDNLRKFDFVITMDCGSLVKITKN
ncbi:MAG: ABC transporter ATP-binding protein [Candidatus Izemoplasmatales bacterium]|nr:ABC transporter ATP-binding protein [Candidatus Izemoplasmatales bacterium]